MDIDDLLRAGVPTARREPPPDLRDRILGALGDAPPTPIVSGAGRRLRRIFPSVAAAAAVLFVLWLADPFGRPEPTPSSPQLMNDLTGWLRTPPVTQRLMVEARALETDGTNAARRLIRALPKPIEGLFNVGL